ncbi:hypothetical protein VTK56DRAFT_9289 [Thermocarpiscus australiensis]
MFSSIWTTGKAASRLCQSASSRASPESLHRCILEPIAGLEECNEQYGIYAVWMCIPDAAVGWASCHPRRIACLDTDTGALHGLIET